MNIIIAIKNPESWLGDPYTLSIFRLSYKNYPANIYLFKVNNRNTKKDVKHVQS